jgi:myo-inositol-1(or 4)-monophosphatase
MVTEHDHASEQLITELLASARPDDAVVGEEGTKTSGRSGVQWIVDPIDGTTNFLYGLPGWSVSIAAVDSTGTLAGVVYSPSTGELFRAARGSGATCNGRPIAPSGLRSLSDALVGTGFSYQPSSRAVQGRRVAELLHVVRDIRRLGSAAMDLCYAASGRLDIYFEEGLGIWDMAAGELIAREAGCATSDFDGAPAQPGQVVACTPELQWTFLAALGAARSTIY